MNKTGKTWLVVGVASALVLATAGLTIGLVIANTTKQEKKDETKHTFNKDVWLSDGTYHWHPCLDKLEDGVKDDAELYKDDEGKGLEKHDGHVDKDGWCSICKRDISATYTKDLVYEDVPGGVKVVSFLNAPDSTHKIEMHKFIGDSDSENPTKGLYYFGGLTGKFPVPSIKMNYLGEDSEGNDKIVNILYPLSSLFDCPSHSNGMKDQFGEDLTEWNGICDILGKETEIIIPRYHDGKEVVEIGDSAFMMNYNLKKVVLPSSIKKIDDFAFMDTLNLTTVEGLENVSEFGKCIFAVDNETKELSESDIDSDTDSPLTTPLNNSFSVYDNAKHEYTFEELEVKLNPNLENLPPYLFYGRGVDQDNQYDCVSTVFKSIELPSKITSIDDDSYVFAETNIENLNFISNISRIGSHAFEWCTWIRNIMFSSNLESIGASAFEKAFIDQYNFDEADKFDMHLEIGNKVKNIGENAFANANMTSLTIDGGNDSTNPTKLEKGCFHDTFFTKMVLKGYLNIADGNANALDAPNGDDRSGVFCHNESLGFIDLSASKLDRLSQCMFYYSRISAGTTLILPSTLTKVDKAAIYDSYGSGINKILLAEGLTMSTLEGHIEEKNGGEKYGFNKNSDGEYIYTYEYIQNKPDSGTADKNCWTYDTNHEILSWKKGDSFTPAP